MASPRPMWAAIAVLTGVGFLCLPPSGAQVPLFLTVTGPNALGLGQTALYNLTIEGGPSGRVNYTVTYYVTGPTAAGAAPSAASPKTATGTEPSFRLNVTAPPGEQTVRLVVKATATVPGVVESTTIERAIVVITPIVLTATFRNEASIAAVNVTIRYFVDGVSVGTKTLARIGAKGSATASISYLPVGLQPGSHTVRVEADLDGNGIIDSARGELVVSELFYKGTPGLGTSVTVLIGIGVFIPAFLVTVAVRRRRQT